MKKALVVEDSTTLNKVVSQKISQLGYEVDSAFSLQEAADLLSQNKYEFVILDLHLPDGEGVDLITSINSITNSKIVVLTSFKDSHVRQELFKYGIVDYIIKDINLKYSIEEVVKVIKHLQNPKKEKILIIDDSKFLCNQVSRLLTPRNYKVEFAHTGREGIEKIEKNTYDLIIVDITLPDINGTELVLQIRENESYINVPIIVLSGTADENTVRNILKNGANEYIKKPFVPEEFVLKVDLWIDYMNKEKELKSKIKQLENLNKFLEKRVKEEVEKNLEKEKMLLLQAKLAQVGEVINIIAHQWKQPLNIISNIIAKTYLISRKEDKIDSSSVKDCYKNVGTQIEEMVKTMREFINFFSPDKKEEIFSLKDSIEEVIQILKFVITREKILIEVNVDKSIQIYGYKNGFNHVILNLINNSKDAFIERQIKNRQIKIYTENKDDRIILYFEDNAGGIPEEIIHSIFDPYFSTKGEKGTGLGLYISKMLIEKIKGHISAQNTEKGARFIIELPLPKKNTNNLSFYNITH